MATRNFGVVRDARVGTDGSSDLGAGACNHLPVGTGGGYTYQTLVKFDNDWSGMTDVSSVEVFFRNSDEYHLSRGGSGDRQIRIKRVTASWSEGSASHPMTSSNAVVYGDIGVSEVTATDSALLATDNVDDSWNSVDITAMARAWAPSSVNFPGGAGQGNSNYGIRLEKEDSADSAEFWSSDKGAAYSPYVKVTYTSNLRPTCVITSPVGDIVSGGTTYATPTVTIDVTCTDTDGDAITDIVIEFNTSFLFGGGTISFSGDDDVAGLVSRACASASFTRGVIWYVRAKCSDAGGFGAYSAVNSFYINNASAPVITGTATTNMELTVEDSDSGPRAVVRFTYADPEGDSISRYVARLYDSTNTTPLGTNIDVSTTEVPEYVKSDYTGLVHGTSYVWRVQVYDASGLSTGVVTQSRVARWSVRDEYYVLASSPDTLSADPIKAEIADTRAVLQYACNTGGSTTTPTTWYTDLSSVSLASSTSFWVRVYLFAWNGASSASVSVLSVGLTFSSGSLSADGWTLGTGASLSTARAWYGTRALRIDGTGVGLTERHADVTIVGLKVGKEYTVSGRIFQSGAASAYIRVWDGSNSVKSAGLVDVGESDATTAEFVHTYDTWTATSESYTIRCSITGAAGTYAMFDALKVEEGPVATPWTSSVLGRASVVDAGGVQVDALAGGVFRLRGSAGTTASGVELAAEGLEVGTLTYREAAAPGTPASGDVFVYAKSDGKMYSKDDAGTEYDLTAGGGGGTPDLATVLAVAADANHVAISNVLLAAGSATAGSWPKMTSGTLQTTPDDGSIEMDGDVFYMTTDAGNRGVVAVEHIIRADSTRTFTSNTSDQVIFTTPANGRLTLETGCYLIEGMLAFTSMSATSGNLVFKLLGGGSATLAAIMVHTFGQDIGASSTAGAQGGQWNVTGNSTTNAVTAAGNASLLLRVYGTFEVSAGGTIQPSIALTTAAAAVLSIGSHLRVRRIGSQSMTSVGDWA